jgi:hypothetical protein
MRLDEERAEEEKKEKAIKIQRSFEEIKKVNREFIERKKREKEKAVEEDMKIVEYNREKDV